MSDRPVFVEIKQPRAFPKRVERFVLSPEVCQVVSFKEALGVAYDLREAGLYMFPYLNLVIDANLKFLMTLGGKDTNIDFNHVAIDVTVRISVNNGLVCGAEVLQNENLVRKLKEHKQLVKKFPDHPLTVKLKDRDKSFTDCRDKFNDAVVSLSQFVPDYLIALLATRNIRKERVRDKLAALGIGKRRDKFEYTTTLLLPLEAYEMVAGEPTGRVLPFHWRRGHSKWAAAPKNGKYIYVGPGPNDYLLAANGTHNYVFVQPYFVNADEDFLSRRREYKLTAPAQ